MHKRIICFVVMCITHCGYAQVYDRFLFFNELEVLDIRLHELYDHVDKFVLVGHSMGAAVAAALAVQYPDRIRHLIVVAPGGGFYGIDDYTSLGMAARISVFFLLMRSITFF